MPPHGDCIFVRRGNGRLGVVLLSVNCRFPGERGAAKEINQFTLTEAVKGSFRTEESIRLILLLEGFIDHLHDYTREVNMTHAEWMGILMFLYDCRQISTPERHEVILLWHALGLSALVDMINTRGGSTEGSNLCPFCLDNAPALPLGGDLANRRGGATILVQGLMRDSFGNPLAGLDDAALEWTLASMTPVALTARTVIDKVALRALVGQVRETGVAATVDQLGYGITALAVPIRCSEGHVVAALHSSGYSGMVTPDEKVARRLADLRAAASRAGVR